MKQQISEGMNEQTSERIYDSDVNQQTARPSLD